MKAKVYDMPEEYRVGWVHGFYSCGPFDDGCRSIPAPFYKSRDAADMYQKGLEDGQTARKHGAVKHQSTRFRPGETARIIPQSHVDTKVIAVKVAGA